MISQKILSITAICELVGRNRRTLWAWVREQLLGKGLISEPDLDLVQITDDPQFIVNSIFDFYEERGFAPTDIERAQMLQL